MNKKIHNFVTASIALGFLFGCAFNKGKNLGVPKRKTFNGIDIQGSIDSTAVQVVVEKNISLSDKIIIGIIKGKNLEQDSVQNTESLLIKTLYKEGVSGWDYFFEKKNEWVKRDSALWMQ